MGVLEVSIAFEPRESFDSVSLIIEFESSIEKINKRKGFQVLKR